MSRTPTSFEGLSAVKHAAMANRLRATSTEAALLRHEPIAIVGLSCRFPTTDDLPETPDGFWALLASGREAIRPVPADRWDVAAYYDPDPGSPGKTRTRHAAFLRDVRGFDSRFFRISTHEADRMDPQQRLLLELAWEALESSGCAPDRLIGSRTGIFAAISSSDYADGIIATGDINLIDGHYGSGNASCFAAGRLAFLLGTQGPALTIDTACSSSLVAIHQACMSLRDGECDRALVGGAHAMLVPGSFVYNSQSGALAADGRSKAFDESADGFGRGEGAAVVLLRRLADALRDGDNVLAVIRGSAVNHGGPAGGLTVPNGAAQSAVIAAALANAGVAPERIDYIEAHGTGTSLGDPIEVNALATVFAPGRTRKLLIGSVKTNVGHLEAAAGLCGLVKVVQSLRAETIPPHLHCDRPTPHIDWASLPIEVSRAGAPWPKGAQPRLAGISSFGLSGTNAHVVIEEAPTDPRPRRAPPPAPYVFCLSARTESALATLAVAAASHVAAANPAALLDLCFTNNAGRARHEHRVAVVAADQAALSAALTAAGTGETRPALLRGRANGAPQIAFLFTGQGAAFAGMAKQLYDVHPTFKAELDRCAEILAPHLGHPLLGVLFPAPGEPDRLGMTEYAQPALAAVAWSLAELWRSFGVRPAAVLGHSLGEYVAAAVAGMIDIDELLPFLAERGRLMQSLPPGGRMVAVGAPLADIEAALAPHRDALSIAAFNAPGQTILSGQSDAMDKVLARLGKLAAPALELTVSHAFHSPLMAPILPALTVRAATLKWRAPLLPLMSNVTGAALPPGHLPGADEVARHAREPVRFADGMVALWQAGCRVFVEIGPQAVLTGLARGCVPAGEAVLIPSLGPSRQDWACMQTALARLWLAGQEIDWAEVYRPFGLRRVQQPPYPFEHRQHWLEALSMTSTKLSPAMPKGAAPMPATDTLRHDLTAEIARVLGEDPAHLDTAASLLELGADSILIGEAMRAIQARFGVRLELRQVYEELPTIDALCDYVAARATPAIAAQAAPPVSLPRAATAAVAPSGDLVALLRQQLELVEGVVRQQTALLSQAPLALSAGAPIPAPPSPIAATPRAEASRDFGPFRPPRLGDATSAAQDATRQRFLNDLIARHAARTARSKALADRHRPHLADSRASAGFRPQLKELVYPITGARADGCRIWDIDGNEYVDISMDFGANLFGHRAPVIQQAIQAQFDRGLALAPRAAHLGDAAEMICRLTGMDRAVFCQSGTEAVMTAVRLARLATGRQRIVIFGKSYHGHSDGLLAAVVEQSGGRATVPAAAGIVPGAVADVVVLDYDDPASLEAIRGFGSSLAAVLVEPVQSRALQVQPREFLHQLRAVTREIGALMIFDEMITGFRVHPGGVQALFGVEADLATYGKAIGGGLQIAAVAGRGNLLDGIDGGVWRFGDNSVPSAETTFFAGTFNGNPLAAAASHAVLSELERRGPAFQAELTARTDRFVTGLNAWLEAEDVALRLINFGSLFRFTTPRGFDLLFHLLLERGVFVWEGRNCFLSAAHDDAALAFVTDAVKQSVLALRAGGVLPTRAKDVGTPTSQTLPLSDAQRQLWLVNQLSPQAARAYVEPLIVEIEGTLDEARLTAALQAVVARHEALRTTIDADGRHQNVHATMPLVLSSADAAQAGDAEAACRQFVDSLLVAPFDLVAGPLLRAGLFRFRPDKARLVLVTHHLIIDGWSLGVILTELLAVYGVPGAQAPFLAKPARQFRAHLAWLEGGRDPAAVAADEAFWRGNLDATRIPFSLAGDKPRPPHWSWQGACHRIAVPAARREALQAFGARHQATMFATLMAAWLYYLHRLSGETDIVVGFPVLGRAAEDAGDMVGYATNLVPFRSRASDALGFSDFLKDSARQLRRAQSHGDYPYARLLRLLDVRWRGDRMPFVAASFNLDRPLKPPAVAGLKTHIVPPDWYTAKMDLSINVLDLGDGLDIDFIYAVDLYSEAMIARLAEGWSAWLDQLVAEPAMALSARPVPDIGAPGKTDATAPLPRAEPVAPRTDIERQILAHWQELLGVDDIGIEDSFFEAGGHSLLADEAVLWARQTFNVDIALKELFDRPTIAEFAAAVTAASASVPAIGRLSRDAFRVARTAVRPVDVVK